MLFLKSRFPPLAIGLDNSGLSVTYAKRNGAKEMNFLAHFEPFEIDFFQPEFTKKNISEKTAFQNAVTRALKIVNAQKAKRVSLILPDSVSRVFMLNFEDIPSRQEDFVQLIKHKTKKILPFDSDAALVTYQLAEVKKKQHTFITGFMYKPVITQYEDYFAEIGLHCGLIDTRANALVNLYQMIRKTDQELILYVIVADDYLTLILENSGSVLLYRGKVLPTVRKEQFIQREILQSVMFWFDHLEGENLPQIVILENRISMKLEKINTDRDAIQVIDPRLKDNLPVNVTFNNTKIDKVIAVHEILGPMAASLRSYT